MVIGTFNSINIIGLPGTDVLTDAPGLKSVVFGRKEYVAKTVSPFSGQTQLFDNQNASWTANLSLPPMRRWDAEAWQAFILELRGGINGFMLGDPLAKSPRGSGNGVPVVSGANQTGFTLTTRGWAPNQFRLLLYGDAIQIGYRRYRVLQPVNSDSGGNATFNIWPNLRDLPADGTPINLAYPRGLFRLAKDSDTWSINPGLAGYGFSGITCEEWI